MSGNSWPKRALQGLLNPRRKKTPRVNAAATAKSWFDRDWLPWGNGAVVLRPAVTTARRPFFLGMATMLTISGLLWVYARTSSEEPETGARSWPNDPVFNLPYDPQAVHFESVAISTVGQCGPLLGELGSHNGRVAMFANLVNGRGRMEILGSQDPKAGFGLSGTLLVLRGDNCRTSGPLLALRRNAVSDPDLDPGLSSNDVALLMKDMFQRYARAFGSKALFLAWLDRLTAQENQQYSASPDARCPLTHTITFTPPMEHALDTFRES